MPGLKITKFMGLYPKMAEELLPDTASQICRNTKLYSGDLIPYPAPVIYDNTGLGATTSTLYAMRNPSTNAKVWLAWENKVDIAVASASTDDVQRIYYTGDGVPKVTNYRLATSGIAPYPSDWYELGLPIPPNSATPTVSVADYTTKTISSITRDVNNIVTVTTSTAHGLKDNASVTVSGYAFRTGTYSRTAASTTVTVTLSSHGLQTGATITFIDKAGNAVGGTYQITVTGAGTFTFESGDTTAITNKACDIAFSELNATNVVITVESTTSVSYFDPGNELGTNALVGGELDLGGQKENRTYVFTWYTPWEEESVATKPTEEEYIREGQVVTITGLPEEPPTGDHNIRGIRLYRSLSSTTGADYFLLNTLWFPNQINQYSRTGTAVSMSFTSEHNLSVGDRIKISGTTIDETDMEVVNIVDDFSITYTSGTSGDVAITTAPTGAVIYYDISEDPDNDAARYWGDGGDFSFTDDFDPFSLPTALASDEYDPPPDGLTGITAIQNNILVGFVGNKLYFSEPGSPHAWPLTYALTLEDDIVAVAAVAGAALVMTEGYPHLISGSDPAAGMVSSRVDALYPCVAAASVVSMSYGVVYATHDGLAVFAPGAGPQILTRINFNNDSWQAKLDPSSIRASFYGDAYIASHSTGAFTFQYDQQTGGAFVDIDYTFDALYYDTEEGALYYTEGQTGIVYLWDSNAQRPLTQEWKSKILTTTAPLNLGAARVKADYGTQSKIYDTLTETTWDRATQDWDEDSVLTFRMWVGGKLAVTRSVNSDAMFRLPTGYRDDTFEVGVEGNIRVRAIHLAETPDGLREV